MRQSIRGYADAVIEQAGPSRLEALGAELAAVRDVIAGSDDLRRVLVDPGVPVAARRGVLTDLFGSRVQPDPMRLLSFVLEADRASDTVDDITWLAARVDAAARGLEPVGETMLGHSAAEERVDGYATATLESASDQRELTQIEEELFRFQRIVVGYDELLDALTSREIPAPVRKKLVLDLLQGKATWQTTSLAAYATHVGRPRDYPELLEALGARVAAESNRRVAEVRSAVELDEAQRRNLERALALAVGRDVEARVTVDPTVVAGFVATIGDTVIDASARRQLEVLKERLVTPEVNIQTGDRH